MDSLAAWMSRSATPATETKVDWTKCWPAMQSDGGCRQVPCLPRKTTVDVAKCHACHAKWRGVTGDQRGPSAPPDPAQRHKCHACQGNEGTVDVANCHACQAKRRWMSPSATPAKQSAAASRATNGDQARHQIQPSARSAAPATQNTGRLC